MNHTAVKRLAIVYAIQAEIEGMKYENMMREQQGVSVAYAEDSFIIKAQELRHVASASEFDIEEM